MRDANAKAAKDKVYKKVYKKALKAAGLCATGCGANAKTGRVHCTDCAAKDKARKEVWKAAGFCPNGCRVTVLPGRTYCVDCTTRMKTRFKTMKTAGLCTQGCGAAALVGRNHCEGCTLKIHARNHLGSRNRYPEIKALFEEQQGCCFYTGLKIEIGVNAVIDHIEPKAKGGALNDIRNLCWSDSYVNQMKLDSNAHDFYLRCLEGREARFIEAYERENPDLVPEWRKK